MRFRLPRFGWSSPTPPWPPTEIVSGVWQSGHPEAARRWDALVDLEGSHPPPRGVDVYVRWPIDDGPSPEHAVLVALADLVADLRDNGKQVLIHCAEGRNRSGLLVAAVLVRDGMDSAEAISLIRTRRPGALVNQQFVQHLVERM